MFKKLFLISILLMSVSCAPSKERTDKNIRKFTSSFLTSFVDRFKKGKVKELVKERNKDYMAIIRAYFDDETFDMEKMKAILYENIESDIEEKYERVLRSLGSLKKIASSATDLVVEDLVVSQSIVNVDSKIYTLTGYIKPVFKKTIKGKSPPRAGLSLVVVKRKDGYKISDISVDIILFF